MRVFLLDCRRGLSGSVQLQLDAIRAGSSLSGRHSERVESFSVQRLSDMWRYSQLLSSQQANLASEVLLLPAVWGNPLATVRATSWLLPVLRGFHGAGGIVSAIGTSVYLLAESGLLDGLSAITHWSRHEHFAHQYAKVRLLYGPRLLQPEENIYLAASINASLDTTIRLVERLYSPAVAQQLHQHFSPEARLPWQAGSSVPVGSEVLAEAKDEMRRHLNDKDTASLAAQKLGMHPKTLVRHFVQHLGITPAVWLRGERLLVAQELLRTSDMSIGEIAQVVGYTDGAHFASLFRKYYQLNPSRYRQMIGRKPFV